MSDSRRVAPIGLAVRKGNNLTPSLRIDLVRFFDECPLFGQGMPPVRVALPEASNHGCCSSLFSVTAASNPLGHQTKGRRI